MKRSIEASRILREVLPPSTEESAFVAKEAVVEDDVAEDDVEDCVEEEQAEIEDDLPESTLFDEGCAGPVSPAVPIPKSPYERHIEDQDG